MAGSATVSKCAVMLLHPQSHVQTYYIWCVPTALECDQCGMVFGTYLTRQPSCANPPRGIRGTQTTETEVETVLLHAWVSPSDAHHGGWHVVCVLSMVCRDLE
jgi:hypothetical protein